jgi:hypothetical protein
MYERFFPYSYIEAVLNANIMMNVNDDTPTISDILKKFNSLGIEELISPFSIIIYFHLSLLLSIFTFLYYYLFSPLLLILFCIIVIALIT